LPASDLNLLIDAALIAGRVATSYAGKTAQKWDKPDGAGPVTEADLAVNNMLSATLPIVRPTYGWLSEETEDTAARLSRDKVFIIDPIDGTRSYAEGASTWAHSFAVSEGGQITAAVVYLPMLKKMYSAALGKGAWLNGEPLRVSNRPKLSNASVLATKVNMEPRFWPNGVPVIDRQHRPSLAYRLALVAEGKFDAMFTFRPSWEWDIAAGALIVSEAGGIITDQIGGQLVFNGPEALLNGIIAGGPDIHEQSLAARHTA
jgi:myo-inositol-1(or 4)-monophosphatase